MTNGLEELQTAAEGAAPHLVDYIGSRAQQLRGTLKNHFAADLQSVLQTILWPKPQVSIPPALQDKWGYAVDKLLELQMPELEIQKDRVSAEKYEAAAVLLPFEVLVQPLEARFRYHFEGDRPTNRLDKPEYFISHIMDLLSNHVAFVNDNLQTHLLSCFHGSSLVAKTPYIDATSAFITALLPMIRRKVSLIFEKVSSQPQLLSHFIHELMSFDATLRNEWQYDGLEVAQPWKGITWEVLVLQDGFNHWLQVEKDFALSRYQSIIDASDSGELDYDTVSVNVTKPTKAAIRVNDLLETITDRYRELSSFSQKLRFLIDVQISIFDRFHSRLHSSLEAYLTMTSSFGRTVHGLSAADAAELEGVAGLDRLCRVYGSADYLERAMRDWSDDVFFLNLWTELQQRSNNPAFTAKNMNVAESVSQTSATLAMRNATSTGPNTGALFDETANAYNRLRIRSETVIIEALTYSIREALRPYSRINPWTNAPSNSTGDISSMEPTSELVPVLTILGDSLAFLARALAPLPLRRISREVAHSVETYLWERVLLPHSFSMGGAEQFAADLQAITRLLEKWIGREHGAAGLRSLREAVRLLNLPVDEGGAKGNDGAGLDGVEDDDAAWDAGVDGEVTRNTQHKKEQTGTGEANTKALGLWDVEKRLFADNESARSVLEDLRVDSLTEMEARKVLRSRVELSA